MAAHSSFGNVHHHDASRGPHFCEDAPLPAVEGGGPFSALRSASLSSHFLAVFRGNFIIELWIRLSATEVSDLWWTDSLRIDARSVR